MDNRGRDLARRLLLKSGEPVVFTVDGGGLEFDPITGEELPDTSPSTLELLAYPSTYRNSELNGEIVKAGDIRLIVEPSDDRPAVNWSVLVDGVNYRVMQVQSIRKAGQDYLTICQIRAN